jgi:hypothetical protein
MVASRNDWLGAANKGTNPMKIQYTAAFPLAPDYALIAAG